MKAVILALLACVLLAGCQTWTAYGRTWTRDNLAEYDAVSSFRSTKINEAVFLLKCSEQAVSLKYFGGTDTNEGASMLAFGCSKGVLYTYDTSGATTGHGILSSYVYTWRLTKDVFTLDKDTSPEAPPDSQSSTEWTGTNGDQ